MKTLLLFSFHLIALFLLTLVPADAAADVQTVTFSTRLDATGQIVWHDCGDGGAGELVVLSGFTHGVFHFTLPDDGSGNLIQTWNFANVKGVGLSSGAAYKISGSYKFLTVFDPGDVVSVDTLLDRTLIVGKGDAPNARLRSTVHVTFDAAGQLRAHIDWNDATCG